MTNVIYFGSLNQTTGETVSNTSESLGAMTRRTSMQLNRNLKEKYNRDREINNLKRNIFANDQSIKRLEENLQSQDFVHRRRAQETIKNLQAQNLLIETKLELLEA